MDQLYWRTLTRKLKERVAFTEGRRLFQIGETYGSAELINSYVGSGLLDAQFDFNLYDAAVAFFGNLGGSAPALQATLEASLATYGANHLMGNISGNQDRPRFVTLASGHVSPQEDSKLAGYTLVKEEHAELVKRELRVLWGDYFKPEHLEGHPDLNTSVWSALKLAGKVRQEANLEAAEQLVAEVQKIAEIFWATKGADSKRQPSLQGPVGGEIVYPSPK